MSAGMQAGLSSATSRLTSIASILELLLKGVCIILLVYCWRCLLAESPCLLEMLLLFSQREDGLIHLQGALSKGIVALPHQLLAPLVVAIDVEILFGDHMNNVLQGIFVHPDRYGVEAMNFQHVTLSTLYLEDVDSMMLGVQACVRGS